MQQSQSVILHFRGFHVINMSCIPRLFFEMLEQKERAAILVLAVRERIENHLSRETSAPLCGAGPVPPS